MAVIAARLSPKKSPFSLISTIRLVWKFPIIEVALLVEFPDTAVALLVEFPDTAVALLVELPDTAVALALDEALPYAEAFAVEFAVTFREAG